MVMCLYVTEDGMETECTTPLHATHRLRIK